MRHDKKYNELQDIREAKARWWKKVMRAVNAYDKLCDQERRLLKRSEPKVKNTLKVTGEEYTKIRHGGFDDAIPLFYPEQVVSD